jgi:hypothetical protein
MSDRGKHIFIRSLKGTHFTGAIAQNAGEAEDIAIPGAGSSAGDYSLRGYLYIREIHLWADQNLSWEVQFWADDDYDETDVDLDAFLGSYTFAVADGLQNAGTGLYRYSQTKLELSYVDRDVTGEIHIKLVNRSATGKNAGGTGEVVVEVVAEKL